MSREDARAEASRSIAALVRDAREAFVDQCAKHTEGDGPPSFRNVEAGVAYAAFNNAIAELVASQHEAVEVIEKVHDELAECRRALGVSQRMRRAYMKDADDAQRDVAVAAEELGQARIKLAVDRAAHEAFRESFKRKEFAAGDRVCSRCVKLLPDNVLHRLAEIGETCTRCNAKVMIGDFTGHPPAKPRRHLCCGADEQRGHERTCPVEGDLDFRGPKPDSQEEK